ncbi:ParM/StbA family protein [Chengkuizengella axinellae]|uniref:ParM/StbA family protein n=1 Tax=Chengkuizengella axinellae TaxID=3064388 RepID=A0ABT9J3B2_9BACL|nr:ParM/StbA family protein [Chengkuizengella sp. 2205SS18-9]MDP5276111.1 ParM/StbA family protein [Chengkuizengella sp. 2205SS18-9]
MNTTYKFFVANDNGNSEHDIIINKKMIQQPNVLVKHAELTYNSDVDESSFVKNIHNELIVTVNSPSADPGMYKIGNYALKSAGDEIDNINVDHDRKYEIDLPIVNTLARIAACGIEQAFEENGLVPVDIEITVDMSTALPIKQHNEETAAKFENKFTKDKHLVTVHMGQRRVNTTIKFEFVKCVPEGFTVPFALQADFETGKWRTGEIFKEFAEEYKLESIDGQYFKDKTILGTDIGDGTTEYPVTRGNRPDRDFKHGSNHGIGRAIEKALDSFNDAINIPDSPRQYFAEVLKNPKHKFHILAKKKLQIHVDKQAERILDNIKSQLIKLRYEVDFICVYGGGSILMKEYLHPKLKELCEDYQIKLFYVPSEYAITLNAEGLDIFVNGNIFKALKEKAKTTV